MLETTALLCLGLSSRAHKGSTEAVLKKTRKHRCWNVKIKDKRLANKRLNKVPSANNKKEQTKRQRLGVVGEQFVIDKLMCPKCLTH